MVGLETFGDSEVMVSEDTIVEEEKKRLRSAVEREEKG